MRQVFLHIGTNKTGTSSIQKFCNAHREALAAAGVLYPRAGCSGEAHYRLSDALGFTHRKLSPDERSALKAEIMGALQEELSQADANIIIFSSENFVLQRDPQEVREYFRDFDVRIVVYLRRHDSWWLSAYNQAVRQVANPKWGVGLEKFVAYQQKRHPHYGDWKQLVDRWAAVFGKEAMIVRPFERQQNGPHILADFFRQMGIEQLAPSEAPSVNESLDAWSLRMIDIAQRSELDDAVRKRIIHYTLQHPKGGAPLRVPANLKRQFVEIYKADYEYIAREYLDRSDGRLFFDVLQDEDAVKTATHEPGPRDVMAWTASALSNRSSEDG